MKNNNISACLSMLCMLGLLAGDIFAQTTRYVSPAGNHTYPYTSWETAALDIWSAVSAANTNSAGDTVWIDTGHYTLDATIIVSNTQVRGFSGNPADVIVDGDDSVRVFQLRHTNSVLTGLTVTGGRMTGATLADAGAGISVFVPHDFNASDVGPVISNCVVTANTHTDTIAGIHAAVGGSTLGRRGFLRIYDTLITNNTGIGIGNWSTDGAYAYTYMFFYGCRIENNTSHGVACLAANHSFVMEDSFVRDNSGYGMFVSTYHDATIRNTTISGNNGHGLRRRYGSLYLYDSTVSDNTDSDRSAGIDFISDGNVTDGIFSNVIITGNSSSATGAEQAGGIRLPLDHNNTTVRMYNVLVADNSFAGGAGGIFVAGGGSGSMGLFHNCTIVNNETSSGGGVGGISLGTDNVWVYNTIIHSNLADGSDSDLGPAGNVVNFHYSCSPDLAEENGNITNNPIFIDMADGNYRLRGNSPCIGTGNALDWTESDVDLDGNPRLFRGAIDMGCYQHRYVKGTIFQVDGLMP